MNNPLSIINNPLVAIDNLITVTGDLDRGAKILCAVSGGADSVYMLHILPERLPPIKNISLGCAHYNHGLRGHESDRDESFTRELCERLNIPFFCEKGDVCAYARENRLGTEAAARELRYKFLQKIAEENGYDRIATAHNANDNLETMLLNLCRGSGGTGLMGIPPQRGGIIRPILDKTRAEIEDYLEKRGIGYVTDSSNDSDDYARNRIRHHVLPSLAGINPAYIKNAARAASLLRADEEMLSSMAKNFIKMHKKQTGDGSLKFLALSIRMLPLPVSTRVVRRAAGKSLSLAQVEAIIALCARDVSRSKFSASGITICREGDFLIFFPPEPISFSPRELALGETITLEALKLRITASVSDFPDADFNKKTGDIYGGGGKLSEINDSFNIFYFQYDSVCGKMLVRLRQGGDRLRQNGRGLTKTIKRLFQEAHMPLWERERTPILADDNGPLAVPGFGIDERAAPIPGKKAIKVVLYPYD